MGPSLTDEFNGELTDIKEQLEKRQQEILTLQRLSTEFAMARDKQDLLTITRDKLRTLFGLGENGVAIINDDGCTMTPFLSEPDSITRTHSKYKTMLRTKYPIADGVLDQTLNSPEPVIFYLKEIADKGELPEYFQIQFDGGISRIVMSRLCTGKTAVGFWGITLTDEQPMGVEQLYLVKYISHLMATALSNVLANEDIHRRQLERETLLSMSVDIAAARTTEDLMTLIRVKLKDLIGITNTGMVLLNKETMTCIPLMADPLSTANGHPDYLKATTSNFSLYDGIFDKAFARVEPVVFDLKELAQRENTPIYVTVTYESGLKWLCISSMRHGGEVLGFWLLFFEDENAIDSHKMRLIQGLSNQLSIAVSNIAANEDIQRRQLERETLLSLSIDVASARTIEDLMLTIRLKLKQLLGFTNTGMTFANKEKMTCTPVLTDPNSTASRHPAYISAYSQAYPIYDGLGFEQAFATDKPVVFDLEELAKRENPPLYVTIPQESGLKTMCIIRLCHREDILGFWMIYYENESSIDDSRLRMIEGLSNQLSVALSNILANDIIARNLQDVRHQKQQLKEEKTYLMEEIAKFNNSWDLVGEGEAMQAIFKLVRQVAQWDSTVLILGETGTGKELIARAIHNNSPRKQKMMVKVNCAALPPLLIESELFGHERGSFTGAFERRIGKFELAHDGTLFLDEIGELPLELQVKLLRALQEREIERVGGKTTIKVNVRIIAATNRDLEKEMGAGRFRPDLFYRLNIFPIQLPPLRERKEDILLLATHFIKLHAKKIGKQIDGLNPKILQELMKYSWPGNIRELENILERSVLLAGGDTIHKINLPPIKVDAETQAESEIPVKLQSLADNEKHHILSILKYCGEQVAGKNGAAAILGIPASTLISRMKRLGIEKAHIEKKIVINS